MSKTMTTPTFSSSSLKRMHMTTVRHIYIRIHVQLYEVKLLTIQNTFYTMPKKKNFQILFVCRKRTCFGFGSGTKYETLNFC